METTNKAFIPVTELPQKLGLPEEEIDYLIETGQLIVKTLHTGLYVTNKVVNDLINGSEPVDCLLIESYTPQPTDEEITVKEAIEMAKRPRGSGSIIFNKNRNRYQAMFFYDEGGAKKRKIVTCRSFEEANHILEQATSNRQTVDVIPAPLPTPVQAMLPVQAPMSVQRAEEVMPVVVQQLNTCTGEKHLITDILRYVMEDKRSAMRKMSTLKWYGYLSKFLEEFFAGMYIENLTSDTINIFQQKVSRAKGRLMSEKYVKTQRELLQAISRYALSKHFIAVDPFAYGVMKLQYKRTNPHDKCPPKIAIKKCLKAVEQSEIFKPMVVVLLYSGIRIGEMMGLYWSDIDEEQGVIHIRRAAEADYDADEDGTPSNRRRTEVGQTKTASGVRDVPVPPMVFEALREWKRYIEGNAVWVDHIKEHKTQDLVFVSSRGKIRDYQGLRKQFDRWLKDNGLGEYHLTFHKFRHYYATTAKEAGVDLDTISHLLGHKDVAVTSKVYITPAMSTLQTASQNIGKAIKDMLAGLNQQ